MKKIIIFLAFVLLAASYGNATPGAIYLGVQGGYERSDHNIGNWAQSLSYDTNFTVWGLSLGADISSSLRAELARLAAECNIQAVKAQARPNYKKAYKCVVEKLAELEGN